MVQAIVFLPLLGAILAGLIALAGAHARNPSGDTVEHAHGHDGHGDHGHAHASHAHDDHGHGGHDDHHAPAEPPAAGTAAAEFITAIACGPAPDGVAVAELAGPEQWDSAGMALRLARAIEPRTRVVRIPMPAKALRTGGLLPGPRATIGGRRFEEWLETLG